MSKVYLDIMIQAVSGNNEVRRTESAYPVGIVGDNYLKRQERELCFVWVWRVEYEERIKAVFGFSGPWIQWSFGPMLDSSVQVLPRPATGRTSKATCNTSNLSSLYLKYHKLRFQP